MSQPPDDLSAASQEEDAGKALPLVELETLLSQPPSWRKRFTQMGALLAALAVILASYWGVSRPPTSSIPAGLIQPTSPPPTVSVVSNVNYGALLINGQPQRDAPPLTLQMRSQPPYTITLNAPPFQPLTCPFPPPKTIAPYVFHPCNAGGVFNVNQQSASTLEMLFTLADLPANQQQQVSALISSSFTFQQTTTAPTRSAIVTSLNHDGTLSTTLTTELLQASVFLIPSTHLTRRGVYCHSFICVGSVGFSTAPRVAFHDWQVLTPLALRWRFTTASGQVVSDVTFSSAPVPFNLVFSYDAATGWRLASPFSSGTSQSEQWSALICDTGVQMLTLALTRALNGDDWAVSVLRDQGIAGCELELTQNTADQGHFVWRFGALLAGDAKAHGILPALPVASPAELAAVGG